MKMQLDILDLSIAQLLDDVHGTGANESERRAVRYTYNHLYSPVLGR